MQPDLGTGAAVRHRSGTQSRWWVLLAAVACLEVGVVGAAWRVFRTAAPQAPRAPAMKFRLEPLGIAILPATVDVAPSTTVSP